MHSSVNEPSRCRMGPALVVLIAALILIAPSCRRPSYKVVVGKEGYTHTVGKGETLESIAERYYDDRNFGKALGEYNGIDPLEPLQQGTTMIIPFDRAELEKIRTMQDAYVMYNRGTVLARTGQIDEAVRYLERAVEADPTLVDAWYNLGLVYLKQERPEKALTILKRLSNNFPSEPAYHYSLGAAWRQMDKSKEALKEFKQALEIDPACREAQYALAKTYQDLGKRKQAKEAWQRYLEIDQDSVWADEARMHLDKLGHR
jgi:tetratricopeptide (TPR) repeat protein